MRPSPKDSYSECDKILYSKLILAWKINSERNLPSPFIGSEKSIVAVELSPLMCIKYCACDDTAAINSICSSNTCFNKQKANQDKHHSIKILSNDSSYY